jgi:glycosyltransferase involved in cell wall biosynthesis
MKVLIISKIYPSASDPDYGVFVENIARSLIERGGIVHRSVISGRLHKGLDKFFKYTMFFLRVYKNIFIKKYDLIYVHFANHSLLPLLPVYRYLKTPIVINAHGGDIVPAKRKNAGFICKLNRNLINRASLIIVPSNYYKDITLKRYSGKAVYVSPSGGVDLSLFKPSKTNPENSRLLRIGYISRIDSCKGWDILLEALSFMNNHCPEVKYHAVMLGYGEDIRRFQSMIQSMGLSDQVQYFGHRKQDELPDVYNSFDLFVFPTIRPEETLGLVGIEAMACGVPVIGSRIGGLVEYIDEGRNGYLFTPGNYHELANKILKFNSLGGEQRQQMREFAVLTAAKYEKDRVADDLYNALSKLIWRSDSGYIKEA